MLPAYPSRCPCILPFLPEKSNSSHDAKATPKELLQDIGQKSARHTNRKLRRAYEVDILSRIAASEHEVLPQLICDPRKFIEVNDRLSVAPNLNPWANHSPAKHGLPWEYSH